MHMCFIVNGQKNKKSPLQTEYQTTVIKQIAREIYVTALASSRRPSVSLEYQRLSGQHFPCKIIVDSQKVRISHSCKICSNSAEHEID